VGFPLSTSWWKNRNRTLQRISFIDHMERSRKPVDLLLDFLFVAVQVVLFIEGVYPAGKLRRTS